MNRNPYSPPDSNEMGFLKAVAPPRPVAVWLLLAWLGLTGGVVALGSFQFVAIVVSHRDQISSPFALVVALAWRLAMLAGFAVVMGGLFQRRAWGRWIGVLILVAMAAFSMFGTDATAYSNEAQRAGGFIGRRVFIPALVAWWTYSLAFSRKARRYFAKQPAGEARAG